MQKDYDIIVAGGGLAGCCAAISAAREGCSVLLIERYGFLGGMATAGLVNPFMPYNTYDDEGNTVPVNNGGLFLKILEELDSAGSLYAQDKSNVEQKPNIWGGAHIKHESKHTFNEESLKPILDDMLEQNGVSVMLHSFINKTQKNQRKVTSVTCTGKGGEMEFTAKFFIDATGDADLCALAGNEFEMGRDSDGKCQPMTLCFRIGNADPYMAERIIYDPDIRNTINKKYCEWQQDGRISNQRENVLIFPHIANGVIHFNSTRIVNHNPLDPFDLSRAERTARKQAAELLRFFREVVPGFENCILLQSAPSIGVRESRRIKGLYRLSENDLVECTKFDDSIARGCYPVDIHNPDGSGTVIRRIPPGDYYTIPLRSIVPDNLDNVLVAGRPISSSHEAHSAIRVMPICSNMGEAAGIAASICFKDECATKALAADNLHKIMTEHNCLF